jgi:flavin reductase (DIM6/NTAB) family NADH-FMN oxidoreductase RutF
VTQDSGHTFRQAAGRFAAGVTVVTTSASEGAYGVTVSSFASLSLNPLLVTVSINRSSPLLRYVRSMRAFGVSVLASDQEEVARYFATAAARPSLLASRRHRPLSSRPAHRSLTAVSAGSTAAWRRYSPAETTRFWLA